MNGQIVYAHEVIPGDRILLPLLGVRTVLEVEEFDEDTGPEPGPRLVIVYGLGRSIAFENSARKGKHPTAIHQPEGTLRPYKPNEEIAIERRAA